MATERDKLIRHHAREQRRIFWQNLPRNLLLFGAAFLIIWAIKSCESPNSRYDDDRTSLKGMPY